MAVTFNLARNDVAFARAVINQPEIFTDFTSWQNQTSGVGLGRLLVEWAGVDAYRNTEEGVIETFYLYGNDTIQIFFQDGAELFTAANGGLGHELLFTVHIEYTSGTARSITKSFYGMTGHTQQGDSFLISPSNSADVRALFDFCNAGEPQVATLKFERASVFHPLAGESVSGGSSPGIRAASKIAPTVHPARATAASGGTIADASDGETELILKLTRANVPSEGTGLGLQDATKIKRFGGGTPSSGGSTGVQSSLKVRPVAGSASSDGTGLGHNQIRKLTPQTIPARADAPAGNTAVNARPFKRVPTEPLAPANFTVLEVGQTFAVIEWDEPPGDGNSDLLPIDGYDVQFFGGSWVDAGTTRVYRFTTIGDISIAAGNRYQIRARARNAVGNGDASIPFSFESGAVNLPSAPRFLAVDPASAFAVSMDWQPPLDLGGGQIDHYETSVTHPSGLTESYITTGSDSLSARVAGLAEGERYGLRVRAVNQAGAGPSSELVFATPRPPVSVPLTIGQRVPLLPDELRQSMILRLESVDCRLSIWWQPWDNAWYGRLEAPTNTPVVSGRRLAVNSGLLDRVISPLAGNLVVRALDTSDDRIEPGRNAWSQPSHGIFYES